MLLLLDVAALAWTSLLLGPRSTYFDCGLLWLLVWKLFFWIGKSSHLSIYRTTATMDGDENWSDQDPLGLNLPDPDPLGLNLPDSDPLNLILPDPDPLGLNLSDPDPLDHNWPDPDPLDLNWPDPDPFATDPLAPDPFASDPFASDHFAPDPFEPDPFGLLADWPDLDPVADGLNNSEIQPVVADGLKNSDVQPVVGDGLKNSDVQPVVGDGPNNSEIQPFVADGLNNSEIQPVVVDGLNNSESQPVAAKVEDSIEISQRLGLRRIRQTTDLTETEKALCDGLIHAMARANRDHVKSIEKARLGLWREAFSDWNTWLIPRRPGASILKSRNDCSDRIGRLIAPISIRLGEPVPDSREAGSPVHIRRSVAKACFEYVDKHRCTVPETLVKHKFDAEDAKRIGTYNKRLVVYWAQCRLFDLVRPDDPHPKHGRLDKDDTALIGQLVQPFVTTLQMANDFGLATQKRWPIIPISFER
ncbi:hypothetical protein B0T11DRAFT_299624 [Plectosphaerella cucumerina]|uniref:Uncharacterized protein n=1 Tax=Plectosphaerella cucumerina TaxID=40658 RepID=A0A8K0X1C7_9PEZI|nr:hypothetical protein B0T11DRAFT_299624 [Plectosphaerella cucumerina]